MEEIWGEEIWQADIRAEIESLLRDQEDMLTYVEQVTDRYEALAASTKDSEEATACKQTLKILSRFDFLVRHSHFPDPLPDPYIDSNWADCWHYVISVTSAGAKVDLVLGRWDYDAEDIESGHCEGEVQRFTLIEIRGE